ncbi:glycosyltransferase [Plebeiibacterium sediminum]|uniref:Glycosyltransferase n=1 Tax=Plebeiibacterium sediminum TaxID=2992112 RepID=A0AAE3SFJ2_9BACT|nr:glycosyltransferase [Plebeiobacterium sediminum]MCW3786243.1 glycosyltransferase [Plebeiobacterium sediminum]
MSNKKRNIYSLGLCGFPYGTASVQKLMLMARAVVRDDISFTVISHTFLKKNDLNYLLTKKGVMHGVNYFTTSPYVFSPNSRILKIYAKAYGFIREFVWIVLRIRNVDAIILYSYKYLYVKFWSLFSRIFNIPVYLVYFELRSSFTMSKSYFDKINDEWLDKNSFKHFSGIITISQELINQVRKNYPQKPCFIIPPIVDFEAYDNVPILTSNHRCFLFCGSVGYTEIIDFIIDSFKLIEQEVKDVKLQLIINGSVEEIDDYQKRIASDNMEDRIIIQTGLTNEELIQAYKSAYALLIPLRNTKQDIARFPQKIAEYCASKRPIITTPFGEIINYLNDDSAFYCKDYDTTLYSNMMLYVYKNNDLANVVGENSYKAGKKYFDYKSYSDSLSDFVLNNNK